MDVIFIEQFVTHKKIHLKTKKAIITDGIIIAMPRSIFQGSD